jgi:hypothetical protein
MARVSLDRLEPGADDFHDVVAALRHERGERRADGLSGRLRSGLA